ncbi:MAG: hypothetical protein H6902_02265 [Rhodobacteraceae bacterium]|nr:hypothetical protein [Paracoccaceae bacterium]MCB2131212.1 hypothetical protein [Paracoccaceae bacterium]MCB2139184.1 hypothetical protein [Paracoccaceae bacterium]MCP5323443.1 hypothetical protein [Paracoccaceae bacterium]MCP5354024.1 hypothetical protein [Paracoccaceae bacterium]
MDEDRKSYSSFEIGTAALFSKANSIAAIFFISLVFHAGYLAGMSNSLAGFLSFKHIIYNSGILAPFGGLAVASIRYISKTYLDTLDAGRGISDAPLVGRVFSKLWFILTGFLIVFMGFAALAMIGGVAFDFVRPYGIVIPIFVGVFFILVAWLITFWELSVLIWMHRNYQSAYLDQIMSFSFWMLTTSLLSGLLFGSLSKGRDCTIFTPQEKLSGRLMIVLDEYAVFKEKGILNLISKSQIMKITCDTQVGDLSGTISSDEAD